MAERLGVNPWTVLNWEKGHTVPPVEAVPAIIRFLGYDPFPEPKSLPERLLAKRRAMGWPIWKAARELGVDEGTWGAWEGGETILLRRHRALVAKFVGLPVDEIHRVMGDQWNQLHRRPSTFNSKQGKPHRRKLTNLTTGMIEVSGMAASGQEATFVLTNSSVRSSVLCGAPHKADYVDASIMLSFQTGSSAKPCIYGLCGQLRWF